MEKFEFNCRSAITSIDVVKVEISAKLQIHWRIQRSK